jgi:hypothetical protein
MKFLFDLPNEQLLPATCDLADAVEQLVKVSNIMALRTPVADGENKETIAKRNFKKIYFRLCKEYPKETGAVLDRLWVLEDGEKAPNAIVTASIVLLRKDVISFFTSLLQLAQ